MAISPVTAAYTSFATQQVAPRSNTQATPAKAQATATSSAAANSAQAAAQEELLESGSQTIEEAKSGDVQAQRLVASRGLATSNTALPVAQAALATQTKPPATVNSSGQVIGTIVNTTA